VINGQLKGADKNYHGINPFTEEMLWPAPVATEQDLEEAVVAGNTAFRKWQHTTMEERKKRFKEFADALITQRDEWVEVVSKEAGQPVSACYVAALGRVVMSVQAYS
jgi:acyl-CoA reductase-like NAD-dependent aldehyde dehydrogenase